MSNTIYTATGCSRCKIAKKYMDERGLPTRTSTSRATEGCLWPILQKQPERCLPRKGGIEFPIFTDDAAIRQGSAWF